MTTHADAIANGFDAALDEFQLAMLMPGIRAELGRLIALELSSFLGLRPAKRLLAAERHEVLRRCADAVVDTGGVR